MFKLIFSHKEVFVFRLLSRSTSVHDVDQYQVLSPQLFPLRDLPHFCPIAKKAMFNVTTENVVAKRKEVPVLGFEALAREHVLKILESQLHSLVHLRAYRSVQHPVL